MDDSSQSGTKQRVVSLIASATEILHALGAGGTQVGRSHECDWPPAVLSLPPLTRTKFKVHGATSAEIDRSVKGLLEQGLAVYEVDALGLKALGPDIILTQDQCEVCAVSLADVERAVCDWTGMPIRIVSLRPHTMTDVYADILRIGDVTGVPDRGEDLVRSMKSRIENVSVRVVGESRPKLAFVEWIDPPMSGGHWMPELTRAAGGISLFGRDGETSPWITWDEVAAADPDVVLIAPCGYDIPTTLAEMPGLNDTALWRGLRAVREGRVFVADGNAYFNRPGPRLAETTEILGEVLHPTRCRFGHEGAGYVRWTG